MVNIYSEGEILDLAPGQDILVSVTNPFFEGDRVPVAVSIPIEFRMTETTRRIFQYASGPMMKPQREKLPAEFVSDGVKLWSGELQLDELSDDMNPHYTFVGAEFEEVVSGSIANIPYPLYKDVEPKKMVNDARNDIYPEFGLPTIINKEFVAKNNYRTSTSPQANPECSSTNKYANWLWATIPYVTPALKVKYILEKILPGIKCESKEINLLLNHLAILGLYKSDKRNNRYGVEYNYSDRVPVICTLDLADSLPKMDAKDFVLNFLKMTCSTLYCDGRHYVMRSNKSIVSSLEFLDWTAKTSDLYSCTIEAGKKYSLKFKNEPDDYGEKYSDDPDEEPENVYSYMTMKEILAKIKQSPGYVLAKHLPTGDVFSGKKINAILYSGSRDYWYDTIVEASMLDIVHQAGFNQKKEVINKKMQDYDCSIDFMIPRCIPIETYPVIRVDYTGVLPPAIGLNAVVPIVEFPTCGETRPDSVYMGLLIRNNFVDKGIYFSRPIPSEEPGDEITSDLSLALDGYNGLYETLHKPFAEWLCKDKNPRKINLKLTVHDVANLKIWMKYMFYNQLFFIRTIDFSFNTSSSKLETTAEIVEA